MLRTLAKEVCNTHTLEANTHQPNQQLTVHFTTHNQSIQACPQYSVHIHIHSHIYTKKTMYLLALHHRVVAVNHHTLALPDLFREFPLSVQNQAKHITSISSSVPHPEFSTILPPTLQLLIFPVGSIFASHLPLALQEQLSHHLTP